MNEVYRPRGGRILTVLIVLIATVSVGVVSSAEGLGVGLRYTPWMGLLGGGCWATMWRPMVQVTDGGVRLVNVTRTIDVPWPAIVGLDTRWGLTLQTVYGTFAAWAAPAPGVHRAMSSARSDAGELALADLEGEGLRPGDLPSTASGSAAVLIRHHWDQLRASGYLDDPKLEFERPPTRWHWGTLAVGAALLALGLAGLVI